MKLSVLFLMTLAGAAEKPTTCTECTELRKIVQEYRVQISSDKPAFPKLEARAVVLVQKMTVKSAKLSPAQLDAYFDVMRVAVPADPGAVFVEDTIEVVKANQNALEAKIKKLPSREASDLQKAVDVYLAGAEAGTNDPQ